MPNQNRFNSISPSNLSSVAVFKSWIRDRIQIYNPDQDVPSEHVKLYVDYIENAIRNDSNIDRRFWLQLINTLQNHIKVIDNEL